MQTKKKFLTRKKVAGGLSIILIVALLLGGTYAWSNFTQHKTNLATGGQFVDVTLNDSYTPPTKWVEGQTLSKQVSVTNPQSSTDPVYVRLQFKEYLERFEMNPVLDGSGKPLLFATYADDTIGVKGDFMTWSDAQANDYKYLRYIVVQDDATGAISQYTNPGDAITVDQTYLDNKDPGYTLIGDYCLTNNAEIKDGIYGKELFVQSLLEKFGTAANPNPTKEVFSGKDPQTAGATGECNYPVNKWWEADGHPENCDIVNNGDKLSKYISWQLGTDVITMQEWNDGNATLSDGTVLTPQALGDFWVLDTTDGWAYWANPIAPGESTANIMDSITLDKMPGSQFEYQIHIDQQAVTQDDLGLWADTSANGGGGVSTDAQKLIDTLTLATPLNSFQFVMNTSLGVSDPAFGASNENVILQIGTNAGNDYTVYWGDGTVNSNTPNHTYADEGIYTISIKGTLPGGIKFCETDDTWNAELRLTQVLTAMPAQTDTSFKGAFYGCENLIGIFSDLFKNNPDATDFYDTFGYCTGLKSLPSGLFANNPNVTDFSYAFESCHRLQSLPADLFANNPNATEFNSTFFGCASLQSLPAGLFANNPDATDFSYAFQYCANLKTIPETLFDNNIQIKFFDYTFDGCTGLLHIPAWWDYNTSSYPQFGDQSDKTSMFASCDSADNYDFYNNSVVGVVIGW